MDDQKLFLKNITLLPQKPNTIIRFICYKENSYILLDEDAKLVANILHNSKHLNNNFMIGSQAIPLFELKNVNKFNKVIEDILIVKRLKVEIWQVTSDNTFELTANASPGNINQFEDILFKNRTCSNVIVCLYMTSKNNQIEISVAYCNNIDLVIGLAHYLDDESYLETSSFLYQLNPCECLIIGKSTSQTVPLEKILETQNILATFVKLYSKNDTNNSVLSNYLDCKSLSILKQAQLKYHHSLACAMTIINYKNEDSVATNQIGKYNLEIFDHEQFMSIDRSVVKAFSLFPSHLASNLNTGQLKQSTLYGLLNNCQTPQGMRLLKKWLNQPLKNKQHINERLDLLDCFIGREDICQSIQTSYLVHFPDFASCFSKFFKKTAKLADCIKVYKTVKALPNLVEVLLKLARSLPDNKLDNEPVFRTTFIQPLIDIYQSFKKYIQMIDDVVWMDITHPSSNDYRIKPDVDCVLVDLSAKITQLELKMEKNLKKVADELNLEPNKGLKQEYASHRGHYFRVTIKDAKLVTTNKNYTIIETLKDGVRFVNSRLEKLSDKYVKLDSEYNQIQSAYIKDLIEIASSYGSLINSLGKIVALLDVIVSLATLVNMTPHPYVRPILIDDECENSNDKSNRRIILRNSRHPCIECICNLDMASSVNSFIPNDVELIQGKSSFIIITGPNMGGKSTYIRQIGLCVLMAQIGCYVPCEYAEISIVDKIFTRIGANDYLMKGMSTFMAEITDITYIIKNATNRSLIMIDELGRGTSTFDGFGLSWAISEYIITQITGCLTLFATHFTELTDLEKKYPTVKNMHLKASLNSHNQTLTMLYKVENGPSDKSFGLHVALMTNFPIKVIEHAQITLKKLESNFINDTYFKDLLENEHKLENLIKELKSIDNQLSLNEIIIQLTNVIKKFCDTS